MNCEVDHDVDALTLYYIDCAHEQLTRRPKWVSSIRVLRTTHRTVCRVAVDPLYEWELVRLRVTCEIK